MTVSGTGSKGGTWIVNCPPTGQPDFIPITVCVWVCPGGVITVTTGSKQDSQLNPSVGSHSRSSTCSSRTNTWNWEPGQSIVSFVDNGISGGITLIVMNAESMHPPFVVTRMYSVVSRNWMPTFNWSTPVWIEPSSGIHICSMSGKFAILYIGEKMEMISPAQ